MLSVLAQREKDSKIPCRREGSRLHGFSKCVHPKSLRRRQSGHAGIYFIGEETEAQGYYRKGRGVGHDIPEYPCVCNGVGEGTMGVQVSVPSCLGEPR